MSTCSECIYHVKRVVYKLDGAFLSRMFSTCGGTPAASHDCAAREPLPIERPYFHAGNTATNAAAARLNKGNYEKRER